jgi:PIN domain nuclease of toxin-antitoxin system
VRLLLYTHILLWWLGDSAALAPRGRELIESHDNQIFYSAASIWELRIKQALGKLELSESFALVLSEQPFEPLAVSVAHAHEVQTLPMLHRDPFDRMLIAQARIERLALLTHDETIGRYDVHTVLV